jgi:manganese transport protein
MIATAALPRVQPRWRAQLRLLGPAFVAAVAYVDPGNIATNTSAGARYGYTLIWVIVLANAMAAIIQYLAAKLALATGKSLTELVRERTSRSVRLAYWAQAEVMAITTDVAEVVGGALAFQILLHWPLVVGGAVTGLVSMIILSARGKHRQQRFEQLIIALLAMIALGYGIGLLRAPMVLAGVAGGFIPHLAGRGSLLAWWGRRSCRTLFTSIRPWCGIVTASQQMWSVLPNSCVLRAGMSVAPCSSQVQ